MFRANTSQESSGPAYDQDTVPPGSYYDNGGDQFTQYREHPEDTESSGLRVGTTSSAKNAPIGQVSNGGLGYPRPHQTMFTSDQRDQQAQPWDYTPYVVSNDPQTYLDSSNNSAYEYSARQQEPGPAATNAGLDETEPTPFHVHDHSHMPNMRTENSSESVPSAPMLSDWLQSTSYSTPNRGHTRGLDLADVPLYNYPRWLYEGDGFQGEAISAPLTAFDDFFEHGEPWPPETQHNDRPRKLEEDMNELTNVIDPSVASRTTDTSGGTWYLRSTSLSEATSNDGCDVPSFGYDSQATIRQDQLPLFGQDNEADSQYPAMNYDRQQQMTGRVPLPASPPSTHNQDNFRATGPQGAADAMSPFVGNGPGIDLALPSEYAPSMSDSRASSKRSEKMPCPICRKEYTGQYRLGNLGRHIRSQHQGPKKVLHCEDPSCDKSFARSDARLKHYRAHHPHLVSGPRTPQTPLGDRIEDVMSSQELGSSSQLDYYLRDIGSGQF